MDSTAGHGMLYFLDAFSGYHQIPMYPLDEEKFAFVTPHKLHCYKIMSFRLKNVGATYQRLMTKIFKTLIRHTVEVYVDDIVVKSRTIVSLWGERRQVLGVYGHSKGDRSQSGSNQSYHGDIRPSSKKELQRLIGRLVTLGCFIARFTDKLRPFFLVLKGTGVTGWTKDCGQCCLFRCISNKEQRPLYYITKAMVDAETRYSKMEQTTLALRSTAQKTPSIFPNPSSSYAHQLAPQNPSWLGLSIPSDIEEEGNLSPLVLDGAYLSPDGLILDGLSVCLRQRKGLEFGKDT
ncbi:Transposon Ty3-G Gag-Pol polyprotein [Vitis vinifera]|uniref:Transposon Ty3-G Gag-Pol polyprotein n=1 Tax=Vitis vinifera TaxID=29760 RepID=A0A438GTW8_VITVI|nr:Transposon Ty3-G Gag-Pol polyprotein [Vitis vinifera]